MSILGLYDDDFSGVSEDLVKKKAHREKDRKKVRQPPRVFSANFDLDGYLRRQFKTRLDETAIEKGMTPGRARVVITKNDKSYTVQINWSGRRSVDGEATNVSIQAAFQQAITVSLENKEHNRKEKEAYSAQHQRKPARSVQNGAHPVGKEITAHDPQPNAEAVIARWLAGADLAHLDI